MKFQEYGSILGRIAMVIGVITTATINTASAQWTHHGRGDAGRGCSGQAYSSLGYGSSGGGFTGGSSGDELSSRRTFGRIHAHHSMRRGSRHSAGHGSNGGYGSSGGYGSFGGYASSGYGVRAGYSAPNSCVNAYATNNLYSATVAGGRLSSSSLTNLQTANDTTIRFTVEVEADTQLYINDKLTSNSASVRQFVSSNLTPGKTYRFNVRADSMGSDGKRYSQNRTLEVRAGDRIIVKFLPRDRYKNVVASNQVRSKHDEN